MSKISEKSLVLNLEKSGKASKLHRPTPSSPLKLHKLWHIVFLFPSVSSCYSIAMIDSVAKPLFN